MKSMNGVLIKYKSIFSEVMEILLYIKYIVKKLFFENQYFHPDVKHKKSADFSAFFKCSFFDGASDGNRTRIATLARLCSTTELRSHGFSISNYIEPDSSFQVFFLKIV